MYCSVTFNIYLLCSSAGLTLFDRLNDTFQLNVLLKQQINSFFIRSALTWSQSILRKNVCDLISVKPVWTWQPSRSFGSCWVWRRKVRGLKPEQMSGSTWHEMLHPDRWRGFNGMFNSVLVDLCLTTKTPQKKKANKLKRLELNVVLLQPKRWRELPEANRFTQSPTKEDGWEWTALTLFRKPLSTLAAFTDRDLGMRMGFSRMTVKEKERRVSRGEKGKRQ